MTKFFLKQSAIWIALFFCTGTAFAQDWDFTSKIVAPSADRIHVTNTRASIRYGQFVHIFGKKTYSTSSENEGSLYTFEPYVGYPIPGIQKNVLAGQPGVLVSAGSGSIIAGKGNLIKTYGAYVGQFLFPAGTVITSVAIDGQYAIVGCKEDATDGNGQNPIPNAGAAYLLRIGYDGWVIHKKLVAPTRTAINFGSSVAISAFQLVVGTNQSAMVFRRDKGGAGNWGFVQTLQTPNSGTGVAREHTLAMFGDFIAIGAPYDNLGNAATPNAGSVTMYAKSAQVMDQWNNVQKITSTKVTSGALFGSLLQTNGEVVAATVPFDGSNTSIQIFTKLIPQINVWTPSAELLSPGGANKGFASSMSLDGERLAVGSTLQPFPAYTQGGSGAVILYSKNLGGDNVWARLQTNYSVEVNITNKNSEDAPDRFGTKVAVQGDYAVVSSPYHNYNAENEDLDTDAGAAYILKKNAGGWKILKKIVSSRRAVAKGVDDRFGLSVAIHDTVVLVGVPYETTTDAGGVYVFTKNHGGPDNWGEALKMISPSPTTAPYDDTKEFGFSVSIDERNIAIGAKTDQVEIGPPGSYYPSGGVAWIYDRSSGNLAEWSLQKKVFHSKAVFRDNFGQSVSISGDYLLVGAPGENEDVNEKNYLNRAGAAYLFGRNVGGDNNWGLIRKIVSDARTADDYFGWSVSLDGDYGLITDQGGRDATTIVLKKDQGGLGNWGVLKKLTTSENVGPDLSGYCSMLSGDYVVAGGYSLLRSAVYVFKKDQGGIDNWGQHQILRSNIYSPGDQFGYAVATDGKTILVGSPFDDDDENEMNSALNAGSAYIFTNTSTPAPVTTYRINTGGSSFAASGNRSFGADALFSGTSKISEVSGDILNTTDDALYLNARVGAAFGYDFPIENGTYNVTLHFAETFWGVPGRGGSTATNKRRFHVDIEGARRLTNYDISVAAGGPMRARTETFNVTVTDGVLDVDFLPGLADNPLIAAIEIVPGTSNSIILGPVADATVRNVPNEATNFGTLPNIEIKTGSLPSYQRMTYLKFALGSISQVGSAKLRFFGSNIQSSAAVGISAFGVATDSWTETGITWANAPAGSGAALGSVDVNNTARYYEIDVTSFVQSQLSGDKTVSLLLTNPGNQNLQTTFNSRENPANQPQLVIQTSSGARAGAELLSMQEEEQGSTVFPNPVSGRFSIQISDKHEGNVSLTLTNLAGQSYFLNKTKSAKPGSTIEINTASMQLNEGMYLLRVESSARKEVIKMLVLK